MPYLSIYTGNPAFQRCKSTDKYSETQQTQLKKIKKMHRFCNSFVVTLTPKGCAAVFKAKEPYLSEGSRSRWRLCFPISVRLWVNLFYPPWRLLDECFRTRLQFSFNRRNAVNLGKRWIYIVLIWVFLPTPVYSQFVSLSKLERGKHNFRLGYVRNMGDPGGYEKQRRDTHGIRNNHLLFDALRAFYALLLHSFSIVQHRIIHL